MRPIAILILLSALAFPQSAQYAQPPLADTNQHNLDLAAGPGFYDNSTALNTTVRIQFGTSFRDLAASASILPAGFSASVDNVTCPVDNLAFIVIRGSSMEQLSSLPNPGTGNFSCNRTWFAQITDETAWRCDLDSDYCAEFQNDSFVSYDINATFSFGNLSVSVPMAAQAIPVPAGILGAMRNGSGGNLTVSLNGSATFVYQINDRSLAGNDCASNYVYVNKSVPYSANLSFPVGGSGSLFFLRSPVLREQWAGDNRFDVVVLSQSPLYHAGVSLNGNALRNITIRSFAIQSGPFDFQRIVSAQEANSSPGMWSEAKTGGLAQSALDTKGRSFNYAYEFNSSYSGLGSNNLSVQVDDSCLVHSAYSDALLSRMLSFNGTTMENGAPFDAAVARPSAPFQTGTLAVITISFGLAALIIIVSFTNFWLLR